MILSQATQKSLVKLAIEMGLDKVQLDGPNQEHSVAKKGLEGKRRDELIQLISARALTSENYLAMITPEPVVAESTEPVDSSKIKCAKYTIEFVNGATGTVTMRKEEDGTWTVMRASKRLNWMLQPKREWDRKWSADDKTPRKEISSTPRPMSEIRDFVLSHKHEVETFTIDA
tara:strand:- start:6350 stop:6868 length:519 start_codon:yes stop_codon:yes gene_type:complete